MNRTYISLSSLAMDLKRVSLGYQRGSIEMADRFLREAFKRRDEINLGDLDPYIREILSQLDIKMQTSDQNKKAEDALMYSTLLQNYSVKKL